VKDSEITVNERRLNAISQSLLASVGSRPHQVNIRIPRNHPGLERLLKVAETLATSQDLPSGVSVDGIYRPGAVEEFIDALKQVVGRDTVDRLLEQVTAPMSLGPMSVKPNPLMQLAGLAGQLLPAISRPS